MKLMFIMLMFLCLPLFAQEHRLPMEREFDTYWMVFLNAGPKESATELEAQQLQESHLDHLTKLMAEGVIMVAGPFQAGPEEKMRGIVIFPGDMSEAKVLEYAQADPAVKAGHLVVKLMKWWSPKGVITFTPDAHQ